MFTEERELYKKRKIEIYLSYRLNNGCFIFIIYYESYHFIIKSCYRVQSMRNFKL